MADEPNLADAGEPIAAPANDPSRRSKILRRTRVGGTLVAVLVGLFWLVALTDNPWLVWGLGALLGLGATVEAGRMLRERSSTAPVVLMAGMIAALAVSALHVAGHRPTGVDDWLWTALAAGLVAGGAALALGQRSAGAGSKGSGSTDSSSTGLAPQRAALLAAWIGPPLPLLAIAYLELELDGLIALVVLSKIGDIAGYYAGNALGKQHPFPRLSPGKTTEGCTASFVCGVLAAAALAATGVLELGLLPALAFGAAINLASQAGDLAESALKRATGFKDSGTWFGPSGGFLDLTDSLLFSVPVGLLALALIGSPTGS